LLHAANVSLLEELWRRGFARCDAWPEDRRIGVAEALHLQAALVAAMRGHSTSLRGTGPLSAVAVVALVEDLPDLLIGGETETNQIQGPSIVTGHTLSS